MKLKIAYVGGVFDADSATGVLIGNTNVGSLYLAPIRINTTSGEEKTEIEEFLAAAQEFANNPK